MGELFRRWKATFLATPVLTAIYLTTARLFPEAMATTLGFFGVLVVATVIGSLICGFALRSAGIYERDAKGTFVSGIEGTGGGAAQFALLIAGIIWRDAVVPALGAYFLAYIVVSIVSALVFDMVAGGRAPSRRESGVA